MARVGDRRGPRARRSRERAPRRRVARPPSLSREQKLELYYCMRLTRSLEERLVNLYRQTKVVGGLFRSLGQEADAVGSAYALDAKGDILSPLIRNLGSMLVKGATPVEIIKQYMAKGDSPTRGRELNIHFGDLERGFIGQISHLGDMVPVMAGVTLSFKMRGEERVGLVYVGDGATSTGAFHEGINFAAVQRCPLVVIVENNGYAYSTPTSKQTAAKQLVDKAIGYGIPGEQADGNDVLADYDVTKRAVDRARARRGRDARRADDVPPQGTRRARQPVVRARRARSSDGSARTIRSTATSRVLHERDGLRQPTSSTAIDARVRREIDEATDEAEASPMPEPLDALVGVYADPPRRAAALVPRGQCGRRSTSHERADGWGTYDARASKA